MGGGGDGAMEGRCLPDRKVSFAGFLFLIPRYFLDAKRKACVTHISTRFTRLGSIDGWMNWSGSHAIPELPLAKDSHKQGGDSYCVHHSGSMCGKLCQIGNLIVGRPEIRWKIKDRLRQIRYHLYGNRDGKIPTG